MNNRTFPDRRIVRSIRSILTPIAAVSFVLCLAFLQACTPASDNGGATTAQLTVYSPHGPELMDHFEQAFEAANPEVDVRVIDLGSQELLSRVRAERANPQCDVWWGAPGYMYDEAAEEGLLEPFTPTWADAVPPRARDAEDRWFGTFQMPQVILINAEKLDRETGPRSWAALLDERWDDAIILRYPPPSGTMRTIFASLVLHFSATPDDLAAGYRWLAGLEANTKGYASSPTILFEEIARREGLVSLWNLSDVVLQARENNYPFDYIIPEEGTPVLVDGIALVKDAPNPEWAQKYYEFVTRKEALIHCAEAFQRFPTREDIARETLPDWMQEALAQMEPLEVDWAVLAEKQQGIIEYWNQQIKGRGNLYLEESAE